MIDSQIFSRRRDRFIARLGNNAAIIPAASLVRHHADCEYPFRQNSDFWYLTGFDEPDAIALFLPYRSSGEKYILFVLDKDKEAEVWNGFRWGTEGAVNVFGADKSHSLKDLPELLEEYLEGSEGIAFRIGKHPKVEPLVLKALSSQLDSAQRTGLSEISLVSPCSLIHQLRLKKEPFELDRMRQAARISAEAHELARSMVRSGINERQVQASIEKYFLDSGARGPAYRTIVAGGDNACILHYTANNSLLKSGDLVLIDAGCSLIDYYNGDITRTFPIDKSFTGEQKALYEVVLEAQIKAINSIAPGQTAEEIHLIALRVLVSGLIDLGLLNGNEDHIIKDGLYRHLYMHRTGHWLGLDVHDVGAYPLGEYSIKLEEGMVLTVEPGLYISDRLPVPNGQPQIDNRWKGIGIRIEDDVLVTSNSMEVLTDNALKSVKDISC